jgi:hypothetical protein
MSTETGADKREFSLAGEIAAADLSGDLGIPCNDGLARSPALTFAIPTRKRCMIRPQRQGDRPGHSSEESGTVPSRWIGFTFTFCSTD